MTPISDKQEVFENKKKKKYRARYKKRVKLRKVKGIED